MTTSQVKGRREGRAGAFSLSLLSIPLNVFILQALVAEETSLTDLRRSIGSPPQTTMRKQLKLLSQIGVLSRQRGPRFPGAVDYALSDRGRELTRVARVLQSWLAAAPDGPLILGAPGAKGAIKALVDGWSTTLIRALAGRPLSLTELDALISGLTYPSLERRLVAMRMAGQVSARRGKGRGTPYAVTDWLRLAVAPLAAAVRWERRHLPEETSPVGRLDIETGFLLAMPLLRLPAEQSGVCRLAVEVANGDGRRLAGVLVGIEKGSIACCRARLEGNATAWASGSTAGWLRAILERDADALEVGGDCDLAYDLVGRLNGLLRATRSEESTGSPL